MSEKNTSKIIRPRNKGKRPAPGSSLQASHPLTPSESPVPQVHVTSPNVSSDHDNTHRDQFRGSARPSYLEPALTASDSRRSDPKEPSSSTGRGSRKIGRKFSPNPSKPSTPDLVGQSRPSTPFLQPSADNRVLPPSPLAPTDNIDDLLEASGTHATPSSHHAQLDSEGINVSGLSELTITPSASLKSDRKKVIIGALTLVLQTAVDALKLAPVPGLDAIPNLLLTWLQVYETVGGNDDDLKGLDEDIQRAYVTILQPLELLTDQIPREVVQLIKRFHLALKKQINEIELLKSQNRMKRMFLAREIAKRISGVKACINDALNSFATQATTLTLLRTIEASVQSKLEQLPRVAAEHTYVKSKSKCLPSTRVQIQTSLLNHLKGAGNRFV
ncbi:uncharacterized protein EI90DRAFT_2561537 [Cantharellus anzutake]|uniref:uncharacterized protein n=1 Tax=Cantharellus anzutake TaxID=1750568 RepID=UPI0019052317|nr:uncharacterized protein EI90DRAFT_2561537 [Cantharellus anzutake]KAF8338221.1 hypothetical protein EI90DRAFT_2561537 [Cantharellus anzutake]